MDHHSLSQPLAPQISELPEVDLVQLFIVLNAKFIIYHFKYKIHQFYLVGAVAPVLVLDLRCRPVAPRAEGQVLGSASQVAAMGDDSRAGVLEAVGAALDPYFTDAAGMLELLEKAAAADLACNMSVQILQTKYDHCDHTTASREDLVGTPAGSDAAARLRSRCAEAAESDADCEEETEDESEADELEPEPELREHPGGVHWEQLGDGYLPGAWGLHYPVRPALAAARQSAELELRSSAHLPSGWSLHYPGGVHLLWPTEHVPASFSVHYPVSTHHLLEEQKREWLDKNHLFEELPVTFARAIANCLEPRSAHPGDVVIERGALGTEMYFLLSGVADVFEFALDGEAADEMVAGATFGEHALLREEPRNAYVVARTALELYALSKSSLDAAFAAFPSVAGMVRARIEEELALDEVRELFDEIDEDGGMSLDRGELRQLLMKLGLDMADEKVDSVMAEMDADGEGSVERQEFLQWWRKAGGEYREQMTRMKVEMDYVQDLFGEFDDDGSGEIGEKELASLMVMLGVSMVRTQEIYQSPACIYS